MGDSSQRKPTKDKKNREHRAGETIEEALRRPSISPEDLYRLNLMDVGRNGIYDACNTGEIECFRRGKKIIIPCAPLRRKFGFEAA